MCVCVFMCGWVCDIMNDTEKRKKKTKKFEIRVKRRKEQGQGTERIKRSERVLCNEQSYST